MHMREEPVGIILNPSVFTTYLANYRLQSLVRKGGVPSAFLQDLTYIAHNIDQSRKAPYGSVQP